LTHNIVVSVGCHLPVQLAPVCMKLLRQLLPMTETIAKRISFITVSQLLCSLCMEAFHASTRDWPLALTHMIYVCAAYSYSSPEWWISFIHNTASGICTYGH